MKKCLTFGLILLALTSCNVKPPYVNGKSAADIPSHVDTVRLEKTYIFWGKMKPGDNEPPADTDPNKESKEMLEVARPSIISQLTNFGYKVVEEDKKADVAMRCAVHYINLWPLTDDSMMAWCGLYDADDTFIYYWESGKPRPILAAIAGPTRKEMASSLIRDTVIAVVKEMQKGTRDTEQKPPPHKEVN